MNSGSCINAISSKVTENLRLKVVHHHHSKKVSLINAMDLEVKQQCLVPVEFNFYKDNIWCDVITMHSGQIILGKSWLYDKDVTMYDRSNVSI